MTERFFNVTTDFGETWRGGINNTNAGEYYFTDGRYFRLNSNFNGLEVSTFPDFSIAEQIPIPIGSPATISKLFVFKNRFYAWFSSGELFSTDNGGTTWEQFFNPNLAGLYVTEAGVFRNNGFKIERLSADDFSETETVYNGEFQFVPQEGIRGVGFFEDIFLLGLPTSKILRSENAGLAWETLPKGLPVGNFYTTPKTETEFWKSNHANTVFKSNDARTWEVFEESGFYDLWTTHGKFSIYQIANHNSSLFFTTFTNSGTKLFKSSDGGSNWELSFEIAQGFALELKSMGNRLWIFNESQAIFPPQFSDDDGQTWQQISLDFPRGTTDKLSGFIPFKNQIFAIQKISNNEKIVYKKPLSNGNWQPILEGFEFQKLLLHDDILIAVGVKEDASIRMSLDFGKTWRQTGNPLPQTGELGDAYDFLGNVKGRLFFSHREFKENPFNGSVLTIAHPILLTDNFGANWKILADEPSRIGTFLTHQNGLVGCCGRERCVAF